MKKTRMIAITAVLAVMLSSASIAATAQAASVRDENEAPPEAAEIQDPNIPAPDTPSDVPVEQRDAVLGSNWALSSDVATTAVGDASGFTIYSAQENDGYAWHALATLSVAGVETDRWIGNTCLTADRTQMAVVYGPRTSTNDAQTFARGEYGAIVDMASGAVTDLGRGYSMAYFNPGCGEGNDVVFTQFADSGATRLRVVDPLNPFEGTFIETKEHVTSAIPTGSGVVGAVSGEVVSVSAAGILETIAVTQGVPFDFSVASDQLIYEDRDSEEATVRSVPAAHISESPPAPGEGAELLRGALDEVGLSSAGAAGTFITGSNSGPIRELPSGVQVANVAVGSAISSNGKLAIEAVRPFDVQPDEDADVSAPAAAVSIEAHQLQTDTALTFVIPPGATTDVEMEEPRADPDARPMSEKTTATGTRDAESVSVTENTLTAVAGSGTSPIETERACGVPRNDPGSQALQPKPRQVEWAVNQAVVGQLKVSRPASYLNVGTAYTPQGLFPLPALSGGGRVPSQVMLGILAQESNLSQASRYTTPGVTGNPLVGNFYGYDQSASTDNFSVDFSSADCGYGVSQVTDNMRVGQMTTVKQRAIALDYAANVAAGLQILVSKWNETKSAGLTLNGGDPQYLENWFFAVWAYNTGFHAKGAAGASWGVGWSNNPINPDYKPNRGSFLDDNPSDAATPQNWPYPEKVLGFAANSYLLPEDASTYVTAYRAAWWLTAADRTKVKPPVALFCNSSNNCDKTKSVQPTAPGVSNDKPGPCLHKNSAGQYDLECWFHSAATWKTDCESMCGNETLRFDPGYAEQADAQSFLPNCSVAATDSSNPFSRGLPSGTVLVIDDVPNGSKPQRPNASCTPQTSSGSFNLKFGAATNGTFPSKVDFHQLGAGFNEHFYFAHTRNADNKSNQGGALDVTGTWTLSKPLNQWARVLVHMPDHGAWTQQAQYTVNLGNGKSKVRSLLQRTGANSWVPLGTFQFAGTPSVSLSNLTHDGDGNDDVAWDAIAIQPLSAKPTDFVVGMGDSFSSGEGASDFDGAQYYNESDNNGDAVLPGTATYYNNVNDNQDLKYNRDRNACHRSSEAWVRKAAIGKSTSTIGARADAYSSSMDFHFIACSGAETENILPFFTAPTSKPTNGFSQTGRWGKYREDSQMDRGFLDENTTLVTLTVGGNDARFAKVIEACIALADCANKTLSGDSKKLPAAEQDLINGPVFNSILTTLKEISTRAPNAKILIQGYPKLFETQSTCLTVADSQRGWLNNVSDLLNSKVLQAANSLNTSKGKEVAIYADPNTFFTGHNLCAPSVTAGLNAFIFVTTDGDNPKWTLKVPGPDGKIVVPSQQSVHPNKRGTGFYASSMMAELAKRN